MDGIRNSGVFIKSLFIVSGARCPSGLVNRDSYGASDALRCHRCSQLTHACRASVVIFVFLFFLFMIKQGGGGPFTVLSCNRPGRVDPAGPIITGHSAAVLDFDFNPFDDNMLATASDDSTVKVRETEIDGVEETV